MGRTVATDSLPVSEKDRHPERIYRVPWEPSPLQVSEMQTMARAMLDAVGKIDVVMLYQLGVFTAADETGQLP